MHKSKSGFTIVELVIVVGIIGILTTIVVVAYKGVQERAYNVQVVSGVKEYLASIRLYQAVNNGTYPQTNPEVANNYIALSCLGTGYPGGTCGTVTNVVVNEDSLFNTQLATVMKSMPNISNNNISVQNEAFTGAVYGIDITGHSSTGKARTIQYALFGTNADCVISGAWSYNVSSTPATTACELILAETPA